MADVSVVVSPRLTIPREELVFRATRSGGPGGQHVNTSSTRIELVWNVMTSPSLDDSTRDWLLKRLATRLDGDGQLRIVAQSERSQLRNRDEAVDRLIRVVAKALEVPKLRKKTRPTKASKERRLEGKKRRAEIKMNRGRGMRDE